MVTNLQISDDRLRYTFSLKPNNYWSDGTPITAEDYVWTYIQLQNTSSPYHPENLEAVTAPDSYTIVFKFNEANPNNIVSCDHSPLPHHIWQTKSWDDPEENGEIENPTVVSGAWQLKEWRRGQSVTFVPNPNCSVETVPLLDSLTIYFIPDVNIQFEKFQAGELDCVEITASEYQKARQLSHATLYEYYSRSNWTYVGFNFRRKHFQDIHLRQAMAYVTPRKEIISKILFNLAQPIYSTVAQSSPLYHPRTPRYEYNLEKAKMILANAGYIIENDRLHNQAGELLPALKLYISTPNKERLGIANLLQQHYLYIGLELEINLLDSNLLREHLSGEPYDYDLFIAGWKIDYTPETFNYIWQNAKLNWGAWDTPASHQILELYEQANQEFDYEKRKSIMAQIQIETAKDLPYLFLFEQKRLFVVSNKLNVSPITGLGINYNNYADWNFK